MARASQRGFSLIEILIALTIISILAATSVPRLLGAREKARVAACDKAFTTVAAELELRLEDKLEQDDPTPADSAIDDAIDRFGVEAYTNPRNRSEPAYEKAVPSYVPTVDSGCVVYLYDGSNANNPRIIFTQYEGSIRSYQISLD